MRPLFRHVRKNEGLASFRQRGPRIPQAFIMFALLWVVCFLRQRCASGNRFPCALALGSHVVRPFIASALIGSDHAVLSRSGLCCLGSSTRLCRCFLCRLGYVLCSVHHPLPEFLGLIAQHLSLPTYEFALDLSELLGVSHADHSVSKVESI
jgi:hypothetical protein